MRPPSILVVDDNDTIVELIREVLRDVGYPDADQHTGDDAFQRVRDEQPILVILDISVSNPARGWATLDAMKSDPRTREIPVIVCSTILRLLDERAELLRDLNCQVMEKPFELEMAPRSGCCRHWATAGLVIFSQACGIGCAGTPEVDAPQRKLLIWQLCW
jgi:CheY-like chemotaxis protein